MVIAQYIAIDVTLRRGRSQASSRGSKDRSCMIIVDVIDRDRAIGWIPFKGVDQDYRDVS